TEDSQIHDGIGSDEQSQAEGMKEENKIERKYGVRFAEPRAEAGFFQGTQEQGYGQGGVPTFPLVAGRSKPPGPARCPRTPPQGNIESRSAVNRRVTCPDLYTER